jgi:hypothetical protein
MQKKISLIVVLAGLLMITAAFTWPWEPKEEAVKEAKPAKTVEKKVSKAEVEKKEKAPTKVQPTIVRAEALPMKPPAKNVVRPTQALITPKAQKMAVIPKSKAKLSTDPAVVKSELLKIMEFNKVRQAELKQQMITLNQTLQKAQVYNKILTNMYPTAAGRNIAAKAVNQEKVRVLHKEVKALEVGDPRTIPAVKVATTASTQARQAKRAGVLPIGKNAAKT